MRSGSACAVIYLFGACAGTPSAPVLAPVGVPLTAATALTASVPSARDDLAPWTLTASDGSGLVLARVDAKAVIEGPLAFTELHLYFRNDQGRTREGTFQITLPPHAAVSRFAMEDAGHWMEAEVVPKLIARRAYDDFLHRRQDPALLEKSAGNQFTAKVFPIGAHADKHLVVCFIQELPGTRYALPLRGLPSIERIDVELAIAGASTQRLAERNWRPDRDFVAASSTPVAVSAGTLVAAQVTLAAASAADAPRGITVMVDTSASRALGFEAYVASVQRLVGELGAQPVEIVAFDQDTELIFAGRASELGEPAVHELVERGAAGASDLGQAIAWLAHHRHQSRVVVIGDGVITAGIEGRQLESAIASAKLERIDYVLAGGLRDDRTAALVAGAGARRGAVLDLDSDPVAVALGESVMTDVAIDVPGATWVYPRTIASVRAGSQAIVYARLAKPASRIDVIAGGNHHVLEPIAGMPPLVERAVAGAELAELELQLASAKGDAATRLRAAITKRSVATRVLSSETSLLVLESEADYARYGIERNAEPTSDPPALRPLGPPLHEPATPPTPAPDNDRDAVIDDEDGCPEPGRLIVSNSNLVILKDINFEAGRATITSESNPILDLVATTLADNPDIALLEIQGHTDERGDDSANLELSERRAAAVKDYLVAKGVAAARLEAKGFGETLPIDPRHNPTAWAKNRRVAFVILHRGEQPSGSPPAPAPVPAPVPAITGELARIRSALTAGDLDTALAKARDWHTHEPGNVLALIGLGEALEARHADATAARVYGSIIDLFPGRADMRRFAGELLARLPAARDLAIDTYRRAVADRPDHLTGHRLLAYALVRANQPADAFAAILAGLDQTYRSDSFSGGLRVLGEDAGMIGAVYAASVPAKRAEIVAALEQRRLALATVPSTRFILYWETDANDVDLHITDAHGGHAYFRDPKLASGGELYADVTTGYGPECFAIAGTPQAGPYQLSIDYYSQGPMGYGMGLLEIQTFDPRRGFTFDDRPYVIMTDHAKLDLGRY